MVRKRIILILLLLIPMLFLNAHSLSAWEQWDCFRWPEKEMTMNIGDLGTDSIDGESWKNIAITSIENWFQYCSPDADFDWKYIDSPCSANTWDRENCTGFGDLGSCAGSGTITLGVTKIRYDGCDFIEADVRINSKCIDSGWFSLTKAIAVMSHEYGHSVGLGHDGDDGLMYGYHQDGIGCKSTPL